MKSMEFSEKISILKKRRGFSERTLAKALEEFGGLDVSDSTVRRWCAGTHYPDLKEALALSRLFGVGIDMLADDERELEVVAGQDAEEVVLLRLARKIGILNVIELLIPIAAGSPGELVAPSAQSKADRSPSSGAGTRPTEPKPKRARKAASS